MIKRMAVENFLASVDSTLPMGIHLANLSEDAHAYGWSIETKRAIRDGIRTIYQKAVAK